MTGLLDEAVRAHGGLDRWNDLTTVTADLSITGAIWQVKSKPDFFTSVRLRAATHREEVTLEPVGGPGRRTVFRGDTLTLLTEAGDIIETRPDPETSYAGQTLSTPWDDLHAAFFATTALWTYFTTPFLYTNPGFTTEEVAPRYENGEQWRGLRVTFPGHIHSHTREQTSWFGPDGLLRRHDYTVDLLGGATGANYATEFRDVGGIMVPTRRRIYAYDDRHDAVPEPLLVAVDVLDVSFA
ncbi:hypothetical protein FB565_003155 [Actinoplanes lutulentus]|uniref:Uncharacterized protein n=1 Tax=Actinoplanes lutulentus TaxID=1287878 RepID=A0A327YXV5_9ACTN|nr:hypothetical protein [Actinoplanes lutulentus]MBB2943442.1 hypothetical protein [Actinoplanes lutulentus]RAK26039.1 hypothetical protein B0I29_12975 [Actinoplanes lutulentus]